jgi:Tfp pilus assembly protein PilE
MIRRGTTLIEVIAAGAILGALLTLSLQMMSAVAAQRRTIDQRQDATLELANAMERIAARPWDELTAQNLAQEQPSSAVRSRLPGAELKVEVSTPEAHPDAKRITASLHWQDRLGRQVPPVTITTWKYRISAAVSLPAGKENANP